MTVKWKKKTCFILKQKSADSLPFMNPLYHERQTGKKKQRLTNNSWFAYLKKRGHGAQNKPPAKRNAMQGSHTF